MPTYVNFITGNANKLREVKAILEPEIEVRSQTLDLDEMQGTIEEVTKSKCIRAANIVNGPVLVDDTSLCFNALGGLPGPYIKWFMSAIGHQGLNNLLAAYADKSAEAVCTFGYSPGPGHEPILFQGRSPGKIVPPRGPPDFGAHDSTPSLHRFANKNAGWDACFEYEGQTYAEMDKTEKNKISHRGLALTKLQSWFKEQNATQS